MKYLTRTALGPWVLTLVAVGLIGAVSSGATPLPVPRVTPGPSHPLALFLTALAASGTVAIVSNPLTPAERMSHRHVHLRQLALSLGVAAGAFSGLLLAAVAFDDQLHVASARTLLGHVGAGLLLRPMLHGATPAVPITVGILVPVVANSQSTPLLSWVINPAPDARTWSVALGIFVLGAAIAASVQRVESPSAESTGASRQRSTGRPSTARTRRSSVRR